MRVLLARKGEAAVWWGHILGSASDVTCTGDRGGALGIS